MPTKRVQSAFSVSVCLCTYNGARFIEQQLQSISDQTRPADEIVVRDDHSSDDTVEIINQFRKRNHGRVRLIQAAANVGSNQNFECCIREACGEIIVLSDQDDIWRHDKLEKLTSPFSDPEIGITFSNASMVSERGAKLPYTLWDSIRFTPVDQRIMRSTRAFELLLRRYVITGATMAFRRDLGHLAMPFPAGLVHDAWLALFLSAISMCRCIDEPLIDYRQHPNQQIGGRKLSLIGQFLRARAEPSLEFTKSQCAFEELGLRLKDHQEKWMTPEIGTLLQQKVEHGRRRLSLRAMNRVARCPSILREWLRGEYRRYGYGWKSVAQDLFL